MKRTWNVEGYTLVIDLEAGVYGNLVVGGKMIFCTPKISYPYDSKNRWLFGAGRARVKVYEKIDGTNICQFFNPFTREVGYKLRLYPKVRNSTFGNFADMWQRVLGMHPTIERLPEVNNWRYNFSYELYGFENFHAVRYSVPIEAKLLFAIDAETGEIIDPEGVETLDVPVAEKLFDFEFSSTEEFKEKYYSVKKYFSDNLRLAEDGYVGHEGGVWYVASSSSGKLYQLKCKADIIEEEHRKQGHGVTRAVVYATCQNAYEHTDSPTFQDIYEMLLEEFPERLISRNEELIRQVMKEVAAEIEFRNRVKEIFAGIPTADRADKATVMRQMMQHFSRKDSRKVFSIIRAHL